VDRAINVFNLRPGNPECVTERIRLVGSDGWTPNMFISLIQRFGLDTDVAKHLALDYGDRAWTVCEYLTSGNEHSPVRYARLSPQYPYMEAEVRYAVHHEYAQTAIDFLSRRSRLSFLNAAAALEALPRVIEIMGQELSWNKTRRRQEYRRACEQLNSMGLPSGQSTTNNRWFSSILRMVGFGEEPSQMPAGHIPNRPLFSSGEVDMFRSAFTSQLSTADNRLSRADIIALVPQLKGFETIKEKQVNYVMREAGFEGRQKLDSDEFIEICTGLREVMFLPSASTSRGRDRRRIPVEKSGGGV